MQEGGRSDSTALASRKIWAEEGMTCPRTIQLRDSEADKEMPDTASGPQLRSSEVRERATPRPRGTPNSDGSRTG